MFRSHSKTIKPSPAQPTNFAKAEIFPAVAPANSSQHTQKIIIHRRSPISESRISKIFHTPALTAISTVPAKLMPSLIHSRPGPTQSMTSSQVSFTSQIAAEPLAFQEFTKDTLAALPRQFPQSQPANPEASDTGAIRGLFTGQVRQRIANAKHYPRIARRRGMEGQPVIAFTLDGRGQLTKLSLAQTSGFQLLDQAALDAVQQGAPYPEIPAPLKMNSFQFKLPISFVLK